LTKIVSVLVLRLLDAMSSRPSLFQSPVAIQREPRASRIAIGVANVPSPFDRMQYDVEAPSATARSSMPSPSKSPPASEKCRRADAKGRVDPVLAILRILEEHRRDRRAVGRDEIDFAVVIEVPRMHRHGGAGDVGDRDRALERDAVDPKKGGSADEQDEKDAGNRGS
jgi:hypothetical protein